MKKMSLKIATESLSREEMRMITGGSGGGCLLQCGDWSQSMSVHSCDRSTTRFYCGSIDNFTRCNCT